MKKETQVKTIDIMVYVKNQNTNGKKWRKFTTRYDFVEDGKNERVTHYPQIKFKDGAFNSSSLNEKDISRGILTCDASKVNIKDKWEVTKDEKTGKDVYPRCWIEKDGVISFTPKPKEHEFHFSMPQEDEEVEEETGDIEDVEEVEESTPVDIQ
jgi:hypothetical protein